MLRFLLDEQISYVVADQMSAKYPLIPIESVYRWRSGEFVGKRDVLLLSAAANEGLTLVTYDKRMLGDVLVKWGDAGTPHGGVVFASQKATPSQDFGLLIRSLARLWEEHKDLNWTNQIAFL